MEQHFSLPSAGAFFPHLYALNRKTPFVTLTPRVNPLRLTVRELLWSSAARVTPRLVTNPIREKSIRCAHCDIQNKIEWLIERCVGPASLRPRVEES